MTDVVLDAGLGANPGNNFKPTTPRISDEQWIERMLPFAHKIWWFKQANPAYEPHYRQMLFHTMRNGEVLCRYRHLAAGRRGGKTLSAAWELLYYLAHPQQFHMDAHGEESDRPLHAWVLTADYPLGRPAWRTFEEVLRASGMELGPDYRRNMGDKFFEFTNGSLVEFKTADNQESLRGAGLDILWIDEAAFIPNGEPWDIVRPALSDKIGLVWTTTTPQGKNWFYNEFWKPEAVENPKHGRVEYWSIQNPYFPRDEWEEVKQTMHPLIFKREYMAAFDAMAGRELQGDWLHYYSFSDLPKAKDDPSRLDLKTFLGVDPAISLADTADRFAMVLIGVSPQGEAFLLREFADRIPFPEQIEVIQNWTAKYRPQIVGIESNAFQAAIEQQLRMMPGIGNFIPVYSTGKKTERILRMAPMFRIGKIKIRKEHKNFIDEWLDYDSTLKNPKDDVLDATEIALGLAGALLPELPKVKDFDPDRPSTDLNDLARRHAPGGDLFTSRQGAFDEHMGVDY